MTVIAVFRNRRDVVMSGPIKAATGLGRLSRRTLTFCSSLRRNRHSNSLNFPCALNHRLARVQQDLYRTLLRLAI